MTAHRVVVVGAGAGGLAAAIVLAAQGLAVTVLDRAPAPGGKLREVTAGGARIDSGPTVFTMRWVFEELFATAGATLADHVTLDPAPILARHAWSETERLDLHADEGAAADAIGVFAGAASARGYRDFCARARRIYNTLEGPFLRSQRPTPLGLAGAAGLRAMTGISPFTTLWRALGEHFADPRLRQLFGRYATYCGASPFRAPATLMLVAHVEQSGVWLVRGGMHRLARALAALAVSRGATLRHGAEVAAVLTDGAGVRGVRLADGTEIAADSVVLNADAAALAAGLFGAGAARAVAAQDPAGRSLSAVTWSMRARAEGFPLLRHTVFFGADYAGEFADIFERDRLPEAPTVYICAQDRENPDRESRDDAATDGRERLFCIVNAPAAGDRRAFDVTEITPCQDRMLALLTRCGLTLSETESVVTTPADFHRLFPGTGGALYGAAPHGAMASFRRPGARTRVPGLYLAGGSVHPGPGVPMAAMSGRLAAASLLEDLATRRTVVRASPVRSRLQAMRGGISTR